MDGSETHRTQAPSHIADGYRRIRHVFIRDLVVDAHIGVWEHEKGGGQRVRINVDLAVDDHPGHLDKLENVVCYNEIIEGIHAILAQGHIHLAETLADLIAAMSLKDSRVRSVRVRVEKLDVVAAAASVGVEIERFKGFP
ncbi:diguanylate cyclase [Iodidimonas gelatinilytica]|uniref:7,8-dihydroneopterin aldolase n=1 Tax=Iodidimonas gelatinilytica TaxID=1236966 RepID=A0A5A7MVF0_9PROT|nr:dihydroneopterin aldolase [Iodidimonas gelatinilytica]GEQ99891.1 diguanylate cyclase [Iodidimonas gelatinilytica]